MMHAPARTGLSVTVSLGHALFTTVAIVAGVAVGASCSAPTASAPAATPSQAPGVTPAEPTTQTPPQASTGPGIGEACAGTTCAAGLECVKYYGIAGARGPEFHSCEKRCDAKSACPDGRSCTTIADGPGQVCR